MNSISKSKQFYLQLTVVFGLCALINIDSAYYLIDSYQAGDRLTLDDYINIVDYAIFTFGLFFMGVFAKGSANRYAVFWFAMMVPIIYWAYEILWMTPQIASVINQYTSQLSPMWLASMSGVYVIDVVTQFLSVQSSYINAFYFPLSTMAFIFVFQLRHVLAISLNRYLKTRLPVRETNLSLIMHRFLMLSLYIDFGYIFLAYSQMYAVDLPWDAYLSDAVKSGEALDMTWFHTITLMLLQLYFVYAWVVNTISDNERPDMLGIGDTATWSGQSSGVLTFSVPMAAVLKIGMHGAFLTMLYGTMMTSTQAMAAGSYALCFIGAMWMLFFRNKGE